MGPWDLTTEAVRTEWATTLSNPYKPQPMVIERTIYGGQKVPRNALCPCGSGKKYKRCHSE